MSKDKPNNDNNSTVKTENIASSKEIVQNSFPPQNNGVAEQANQELQQLDANTQELNLNDLVMDLKTISNICGQKVMEYADITATFKQIGQVANNLSLALSVHLEKKGELDPSRFKLVK